GSDGPPVQRGCHDRHRLDPLTAGHRGDLQPRRHRLNPPPCMLDEHPLHYAALMGAASSVRSLIAAGANVHARDHMGRTALHRATSPQVVRTLTAAGADVNASDTDGKTPAHRFAGATNREALVTAALEAGADLGIPDARGQTARSLMLLHFSSQELAAMT